jgi:hypothetical protein
MRTPGGNQLYRGKATTGHLVPYSSSANSLPPATRKENMELRGILPAIVPAPPPEPFAVQVIIVD